MGTTRPSSTAPSMSSPSRYHDSRLSSVTVRAVTIFDGRAITVIEGRRRRRVRGPAGRRAGARSVAARSYPGDRLDGSGLGPRLRVGLEVELLIELAQLAPGGEGEEIAGHDREHAQVPRRMLGEGSHQLGRHEVRVAGLVEGLTEPVEQLLRGQVVEVESHADTAGNGEQGLASKLLDEPAVTDEDTEEGADLAVEVAEAALRAHHDPDLHVGQGGEVMCEEAQGGRLAGAGITRDEGEASLAHLVFHAPAEVV